MRFRPTQERQADPRAPHGERVMAALATAQFNSLTLAKLRLVTGLTTEQLLRTLDPLISAGSVQPMGDERYRLKQVTE